MKRCSVHAAALSNVEGLRFFPVGGSVAVTLEEVA